MNTRIAKLLSDFGFFVFGKFYGSLGDPSPIYITSKKLYSHPDKMQVVSEEIASFMKGKEIDLVAGTMVSGTPLAMAASLTSQKPFIYLRQKKRSNGSIETSLEGLYRKGENVLVVDDGIGTGATKERFIKKLQENGLVVKHVLVMYDAEVVYNPFYDDNNITIHSFVKHNDLVDYMIKNGYVSIKLGEYMYNIWRNLEEWQKDEKKWEEFVALAKLEGFNGSSK